MAMESAVTTNGVGAEALGRCGGSDGEAQHEEGAHDLRRLGHRHGEHEEEDDAEQPRAHAPGLGDVGVDGCEEQRAPDGGERLTATAIAMPPSKRIWLELMPKMLPKRMLSASLA